jgi:hypothetical protein
MVAQSFDLPLVGRSASEASRVGGRSLRVSGPHPKNPSDFSTSPQRGR